MKSMTCKQLGGACDQEFHCESFEEIAEMSKMHVMEMYKKKDERHINAMKKMGSLMSDPNAMKKWMNGKRKEFDSLPEDKWRTQKKCYVRTFNVL